MIAPSTFSTSRRLWAIVAVALLLCCVAPWMLDAYGLGVCIQLFGWIALTGSWAAFSGLTGYTSLGHAVFYGLGAYVMALGWQEASLWLVLPAAGLVAGGFALIVGYPALRVRGPYFVILTLGISEFVKYVVVAIEAGLGASGRLLLGAPEPVEIFYPMLGLAVAATLINVLLGRSRFGAALHAIREDETAAATLGVPTTLCKLLAFGLSAVIPGMVGALSVLRSTYFEPMQLFSPTTSFTIVTMAIIGGSNRPAGPVLGAMFIVLLSELLWARAPQMYLILLGVLLIGFVLFAPTGVYGKLVELSQRRRVASGVRP
ncbi:MAG: branched-chain amino acid transporter permease [Rhizobacter sp.]|nr:branched-chain amino acid transporter permease [Rhizobacter sp.]